MRMSSPQLETFLARLYTDGALREAFLRDPHATASSATLATDEVDALCRMDRAGLQMAAHSFAKKREGYSSRNPWWKNLLKLMER
jgi:hypothetical protein